MKDRGNNMSKKFDDGFGHDDLIDNLCVGFNRLKNGSDFKAGVNALEWFSGLVEYHARLSIVLEEAINEIRHLRQAQEKQWGAADESIMADQESRFRTILDQARVYACEVKEVVGDGRCSCAACSMHRAAIAKLDD